MHSIIVMIYQQFRIERDGHREREGEGGGGGKGRGVC